MAIQGFFGDDRKLNAVCARVTSGTMIFSSIVLSVVAIIVNAQRCCGPNWDPSEKAREEMGCTDASKQFETFDAFTNSNYSPNSCFTKNVISASLGGSAGLLFLVGMIMICYFELTRKSSDPDAPGIEMARKFAEEQRVESVLRSADRKREKQRAEKKAAKKAAKEEEKQNKLQQEQEKAWASQQYMMTYPQSYIVPSSTASPSSYAVRQQVVPASNYSYQTYNPSSVAGVAPSNVRVVNVSPSTVGAGVTTTAPMSS